MRRNILGIAVLLMGLIAMIIHMTTLSQATVATMEPLTADLGLFDRVERIIQLDFVKIVIAWAIAAGLSVVGYLMRCRWMKWIFATSGLYFLFETIRVTVGIFVSDSPTQTILYGLGSALFVIPSLILYLTLTILSFINNKGIIEPNAKTELDPTTKMSKH